MGMARQATLILVTALAIAGCAMDDADLADARRQSIATIQGDRIRRAAECQAQAIEHQTHPEVAATCWQLHATLTTMETSLLSSLAAH